MRAQDCISVSELKRSPSQILKSLAKDKRKYIFVNNKPVAMIVDFDEAEKSGYTDDRVFFGLTSQMDVSSDALLPNARVKEFTKRGIY